MAQSPPTRTSAWVAAGLLAILTVFVFATLRHYGPESAVRRFHEAIVTDDPQQLQEVMLQAADHPARFTLTQLVEGAYVRGARTYLRGAIRETDRQVLRVMYVYPDGQTGFLDFVARKPRRNGPWLIDAEATLRRARGLE